MASGSNSATQSNSMLPGNVVIKTEPFTRSESEDPLQRLQVEISKLKKELDQKDKTVQESRQTIETLKKDLEKAETEKSNYGTRLEQLQEEKVDIQKDLLTEISEADSLRKQLEDAKKNKTKTQGQLIDYDKKILEMQKKINVLEKENPELKADNSRLKEVNSELEKEKSGLKDDITKLTNENAELKAKITELEAETSEKSTENAALKAENCEITTKFKELLHVHQTFEKLLQEQQANAFKIIRWVYPNYEPQVVPLDENSMTPETTLRETQEVSNCEPDLSETRSTKDDSVLGNASVPTTSSADGQTNNSSIPENITEPLPGPSRLAPKLAPIPGRKLPLNFLHIKKSSSVVANEIASRSHDHSSNPSLPELSNDIVMRNRVKVEVDVSSVQGNVLLHKKAPHSSGNACSCGKTFKSSKDLKVHLNNKKCNRKSIRCPHLTEEGQECALEFDQTKMLKDHYKSIHKKTATNFIRCRLCDDKVFENQKALLKHQKQEHHVDLTMEEEDSSVELSPTLTPSIVISTMQGESPNKRSRLADVSNGVGTSNGG